jgi:hypothetical protein
MWRASGRSSRRYDPIWMSDGVGCGQRPRRWCWGVAELESPLGNDLAGRDFARSHAEPRAVLGSPPVGECFACSEPRVVLEESDGQQRAAAIFDRNRRHKNPV